MPKALDQALPKLIRDLELEPEGPDRFRGRSPETGNGRIFGGFVFAQAMLAGTRTVDGRPPHSGHAAFLRPGDPGKPIDYEIERIRDGRSFTTRRVLARQGEEPIFHLVLSCHAPEPSVAHQIDGPIPSQPSGESHEEGIRRGLRGLGVEVAREDFGFGAFELLVEGGLDMTAGPVRPPHLGVWMRARGRVDADPALHAALLAHVSDLTILTPAFHPHDFGPMTPGVQSASLDHAIWIHAPFRVDEWLYAVQDSPVLTGARALGRALFYDQSGRLVASAVQEGLVRGPRD